MNIQNLEIEADNIKNDFLLSDDVKELRINILNLMYYYYQSENEYNVLFNDFSSLAPEFVNLSNGIYQIEDSIRLNKVSIKGYILESEFVSNLNMANIKEFTLEELKGYISNYSNGADTNLSDISLGIKLYEMLESLERIKNGEIEFLTNGLESIMNKNMKDLDLSEREVLNNAYNQLINEVNDMFSRNVLDNNSRGYLINIINTVFSYHMN